MYQNRLSQEATGLSGRIPFVRPVANNKSNQSFDSYLLLVLASFGIIGFCYVFYCFINPDLSSDPNRFSFIQSFSAVELETNEDDELTISGSFKANQPMVFTLNAYNPNVNYILDFGNGEEMAMTSRNCKYTYKSKGTYQLKMKALFNQKAQILCNKTVAIHNE
jgi:hypothetical protein